MESHQYKIELNTNYYFLEIKGRDYPSWTDITKVLNDKGLKLTYKGKKFEHLVHTKEEGVLYMNLFCEYITTWERGEIESEPKLEGNLHEFYIIENL